MGYLRAVILDNDETTGFYPIVFGVLSVLQDHPELKKDAVLTVLERLAEWMLENHFFRPGIVDFLKTLVSLRQENSLHGIVMYTNQLDCTPPAEKEKEDYIPEVWSPPHAIAYMMSWLVKDFIFDHILTRPLYEPLIPKTGYYAKQFKRVLDLYPGKRISTKHMLFFDDLATPKIILADGIPKVETYEYSRVLVPPYRKSYTEEDIHNCVHKCFKGYSFQSAAIRELERIVKKYKPITPDGVNVSCSFMRDIVKIHFEKDYDPRY